MLIVNNAPSGGDCLIIFFQLAIANATALFQVPNRGEPRCRTLGFSAPEQRRAERRSSCRTQRPMVMIIRPASHHARRSKLKPPAWSHPRGHPLIDARLAKQFVVRVGAAALEHSRGPTPGSERPRLYPVCEAGPNLPAGGRCRRGARRQKAQHHRK